MTTEPLSTRNDAGFTLLEVLMALVILAVGLLALEALGIHASRLVTRAARQSDYAALAADSLESYTAQIRANRNPVSRNATVNGATLRINVETTGRLRTVTVVVVPAPRAIGNRRVLTASDSIRMSANVYQ